MRTGQISDKTHTIYNKHSNSNKYLIILTSTARCGSLKHIKYSPIKIVPSTPIKMLCINKMCQIFTKPTVRIILIESICGFGQLTAQQMTLSGRF